MTNTPKNDRSTRRPDCVTEIRTLQCNSCAHNFHLRFNYSLLVADGCDPVKI